MTHKTKRGIQFDANLIFIEWYDREKKKQKFVDSKETDYVISADSNLMLISYLLNGMTERKKKQKFDDSKETDYVISTDSNLACPIHKGTLTRVV